VSPRHLSPPPPSAASRRRLLPPLPSGPYTPLFRSLPLGRIGAVEVRVADDLSLERRHEAHQLTRRRDRHAVPELVHRRALARHRSEEHTSELQSRFDLVCRLLLEKKKSTRARRLSG